MLVRQPPAKAGFDEIRLCEARVPWGAKAILAGKRLATGGASLTHVAVLGDTGCRGGDKQECNHGEAWPYGALADAVAERAPDLVIHVGDYLYRGTPNPNPDGEWAYDGCPDSDPQVPGYTVVDQDPPAPWGDNWVSWESEFFLPSKKLLETAPWVALRGNHELCSRAGGGWFYFLGVGSKTVGTRPLNCDNPDPVVLPSPYHIKPAGQSMLVLDSANACDAYTAKYGWLKRYQWIESYTDQLKQLGHLAPAGGSQWILTHRPFWGVQAGLYREDAVTLTPTYTLNAVLADALAAALPAGFDPAVSSVISGHIHDFQSADFGGDRPTQLIVGNTGVVMDELKLPDQFVAELDGEKGRFAYRREFGYLWLERQDGEGAWFWHPVFFGQ